MSACLHGAGPVAIALCLLAGCATNPMTGRRQLMLVPEDTIIAQSSAAYSNLIGNSASHGKLVEGGPMVERVRAITDRLVSEAVLYRPSTSNWSWTVNVIDEPSTINAFCMDGGKMAVYTGLLEKIQPTDDELAQVMGHEISHALAGHNAEKVSVKLASEIVVLAITAAGNGRNQRTRHDGAELAAQAFVNLPHSRLEEAEADKMGIELAAKAGYHPHAAVTLWQKMIRQSGDSSRFDFFNDHPASPERLETLTALEPSMLPIWANAIAEKAPETERTNVAGGSEPLANRSLTYVRPSSPETGPAGPSGSIWSHVGVPLASAMQAPEQAAAQRRVGAAPNVVGLKEESKYMVSAEALLKGKGCVLPNMAMTAKGAGQESFMAGCPNGSMLAVQCGFDGCRILQ